MKKFKISESRIRRVIKEEVSRALSEQVDGPVGMDLQLGAERARQGRNPRTGTQETAPVEEEEEEDLSVPYCRKTGTSREPGFSIFTDENLSRGFRQLSSGYVELTDPNCRGVRVAFGEDANWAGVTGTLDGAVSIFFDQREMAGMIFQPGSGPASNLGEWWLANQLLKYDVGYSRRRERVVDDPEPVKFSEDPGDQLFGGPMEENLIKEDPDYLDDARNPSNPTDYSQWTSRDSFDNPYAQDIYEKLWDANTSSMRNRVDPERIQSLASRLYEKQIEIKGDPRKALIAIYDCYELDAAGGLGRAALEKVGLDIFGEAGSYCRFAGWTLNPLQADRKRRTYIV